MTEGEWLASTDPNTMLRSLSDRASDRQYRMFAIACARDELARALAGGEGYNFGEALDPWQVEHFRHPELGYEAVILSAEHGLETGTWGYSSKWFLLWGSEPWAVARAAIGHDPDALLSIPPATIAEVISRYRHNPAVYLRDIFGGVSRPSGLDPSHRTPTVVSLARAAFDERISTSGELDGFRLSVLSDALEEEGAADELLEHLRSPGPHVRGCWVVDLCVGLD